MRIIRDYFSSYACEAQAFMGSAAKVRQVLSVLPESLGSVREALERRWGGEKEEDFSEVEGAAAPLAPDDEFDQRWTCISKHQIEHRKQFKRS